MMPNLITFLVAEGMALFANRTPWPGATEASARPTNRP